MENAKRRKESDWRQHSENFFCASNVAFFVIPKLDKDAQVRLIHTKEIFVNDFEWKMSNMVFAFHRESRLKTDSVTGCFHSPGKLKLTLRMSAVATG